MKIGDKVLNTFTNRVGIVAAIDDAQARCEHDERTAFYPLASFEAYDGPLSPGQDAHDAPPDAPVMASRAKSIAPSKASNA